MEEPPTSDPPTLGHQSETHSEKARMDWCPGDVVTRAEA